MYKQFIIPSGPVLVAYEYAICPVSLRNLDSTTHRGQSRRNSTHAVASSQSSDKLKAQLEIAISK